MQRALGAIGRGFRLFKTQPAPNTPTLPILRLSVVEDEGSRTDGEENQSSHSHNIPNGSLVGKGALVALVYLFSQAVDDTLANMFSWGQSFSVYFIDIA